jgi:hypothetical protein
MSMMKPVDNHTTSIGMTEIMGGHAQAGSRGMTTLEALVSRATEMVHSFRESRAKTSPRRRNACAALRLKLTPNAIGGVNDGGSSCRGLSR